MEGVTKRTKQNPQTHLKNNKKSLPIILSGKAAKPQLLLPKLIDTEPL